MRFVLVAIVENRRYYFFAVVLEQDVPVPVPVPDVPVPVPDVRVLEPIVLVLDAVAAYFFLLIH